MKAMLAVVLAFIVVAGAWAEVAVTAHVHTKFSDGSGTIEDVVRDASRFGGEAVIISDHAEMVNERYKHYDAYPLWPLDHSYAEDPGSKQKILMSSDSTVEGWVEAMKGDYSLPLVCGMEVGIGPKFRSHLLFWGANPDDYRSIVYLTGRSQSEPEKTLRDLISYAAQKGAVLVQAHPLSAVYPFKYEMEPVPGSVFGVEFFNAITAEIEQVSTFERLLRVQSKCNFPVLATGGSDWHGGWADIPADVISQLGDLAGKLNLTKKILEPFLPAREEASMYRPSLFRRTIVLTEQNSPASIMSALRAGRCYACFEPTGDTNRIVAASAMPGGKFQLADESSIFRMKIRGLESDDTVIIGLVDRKGGIKRGSLSGKKKVEGGVATFAFDLKEICPKDNNCGWWLFVMTPRIVTSAIEILPWGENHPVQDLPQASKVASAPARKQVVGAWKNRMFCAWALNWGEEQTENKPSAGDMYLEVTSWNLPELVAQKQQKPRSTPVGTISGRCLYVPYRGDPREIPFSDVPAAVGSRFFDVTVAGNKGSYTLIFETEFSPPVTQWDPRYENSHQWQSSYLRGTYEFDPQGDLNMGVWRLEVRREVYSGWTGWLKPTEPIR